MSNSLAPASAAWEPPALPAQIDEFRLLRPLGRGAMGQVFLGHDTLLDRLVAVKFIAGLDPDERARVRFLNEARAIARLQHPNVVSIYRVGDFKGHPYLVSELVRGEPLSDVVRPAPWSLVLEIARGAARALAAAHRQGVLHRDIKPANMMLTEEGQVKLLDFGLASLSNGLPLPKGRGSAPPRSPLTSSETLPEGVVGTPLYMAPEVRRGAPATSRSDIYSLGCVLFELGVGHAPLLLLLAHVPTRAALTQTADAEEEPAEPLEQAADLPPLRSLSPDVPEALAQIIDRCLRVDPAQRPEDGEHLLDALSTAAPRPDRPRVSGNPYRGLLPFDPAHRDLFFGRRAEVEAVLDRLRAQPLLLIAGGSGVGKTSLCRAGVLPLLIEGALDQKDAARRFEVLSLSPGHHPLAALCAQLAPALQSQEEELLAALQAEPTTLARRLRARRAAAGLLLFIDQLEELFRLTPPAEAAHFGAVLGHLSDLGPSARTLLTVRADYLPQLLALPGLGAEVARSLFLLGPLGEAQVREAILGPAREAGVRFESEALVSTLVQSALESESGLPLLQFALAQLWARRDGEVVTEKALAELGGVAGALARHADEVVSALDQAGQDAARRLLRQLVTPQGERRRRSFSELCEGDAAAASALEGLVQGRLIAASGSGAETAYEVAHDALLSGWERLRGWLDTGAEGRAARQRVEAATREWERLARSPQALWGERQLAEAALIDAADLRPQEAIFLSASRRAARQRRLQRWAVVAALPALLLALYGGTRLSAARALQRLVQRHLLQAQPVLEQARAWQRAREELQGRAQLRFDATPAGAPSVDQAAEALWAEAQARGAQADEAYATATASLEAALMLDVRRLDVRDLLAETLYQRVLLLGRGAHAAELTRHLANYDRSGALLQRLRAPATIALRTRPAGARVTLQRYLQRGGALELSPAEVAGQATPLTLRAAPGSVLLTLLVEGRPPLRVPLLLERGEQRALDLAVPAAVPAGTVYIPPGAFLYGSGDDEDLRRGFLNARPLSQQRTAGYLIGRTEVTFAEWIQFLRALPWEERQRRLPRGETQGALRLRELPDGQFHLTLRILNRTYSAHEGEPIRYDGRARRQVQDWRRMPVSAISWEDAQAYLAWLSRSGRLPGARLCDEREWERAARGADDRRFPSGDRLAPDDANFSETYGRRPEAFGPDEVGAHPRSQSPFGVDDLAGNVWELTSGARNPGQPVFRGGGWYYEQVSSRSNNRESVAGPPPRDMLVGLRVCASLGAEEAVEPL